MKKSDPRNAVVAMLVSEARQRSGRTKSDVTHKVNCYGVGWDSTVLGRIEKQQRVLQLAEAAVLAYVLGVDLYDFVRVRDDDERPPDDDFAPWLLEQVDRDDPVGDLARDARAGRHGRLTPDQMRDLTNWAPALESIDRAEAEWLHSVEANSAHAGPHEHEEAPPA